MIISCSSPHCIPSAWELLSPLSYETTKNSLDTHACVTQKHVGVGVQGNIKLTSSIQDEEELFSLSLPTISKGWFRGRRSIWPLWRLPVRLGSRLITKLVSLSLCIPAFSDSLPFYLHTFLPANALPGKHSQIKRFSSLFQGTQTKKGVTTIIDLVPLLFVSLLHSYYSHQYIM